MPPAKTYANDRVALHLRAMNTLYEGLKKNSTIVIVRSSAVEMTQLALAGMTALTMGMSQDRASKEKEEPKPNSINSANGSCLVSTLRCFYQNEE